MFRTLARAFVSAVALALMTTMATGTAHAAEPFYNGMSTTTYPTFASASYKGWGYVSYRTAAPAWRWSSAGWQATSWKPGTSAWLVPFAQGWHWAWRDGAWHAMQTRHAATWTCTNSGQQVTVQRTTKAHRYNTSTSDSYGYLGVGTTVKRLCGNYFADATASYDDVYCMSLYCGPQSWILVEANPVPGCSIPIDPNGPICMIAAVWNPRPVYIPAASLEFWLVPQPVPEPLG